MVKNMDRIYLRLLCALAAVTLAGGCRQDIVEEVSCSVKLDPANTFLAGDPVRFSISGQPDNILFYSGETGSQYRFKDRFSVPVDQVNSATLTLDYQGRYGYAGGLDIYVSDSFAGLKGDDGAADRATVKALVDGGMAGWTKLDYDEGASTVWTHQSYDVGSMLENFTLAFHWHPIRDGKSAQRTYWVDGHISLDMVGSAPSTMPVIDLQPVVVMMNEEVDPYHKNAGNGSVRFDNPTAAPIVFQGAGATVLDYALDGWVFMTPSSLNKVENDKGTVIKNLQNWMDKYEYIYTEPGNYTATFVCVNENVLGGSEQVRQVRFSVIEKP